MVSALSQSEATGVAHAHLLTLWVTSVKFLAVFDSGGCERFRMSSESASPMFSPPTFGHVLMFCFTQFIPSIFSLPPPPMHIAFVL